MTRRERLERKLEKRRRWAAGRQAAAAAHFQASRDILAPIPPGQPILVGHHSERRHRRDLERSDGHMSKAVESSHMAEHHENKAEGIERQLETSTFSDDPDAIEQLQAKIADMEAQRDRLKAYNASCRKGARDESLLDEAQRKDLHQIARVCSYQRGKNDAMPAYVLSNLGANIRRLEQRIEDITQRQARTEAASASASGVLIEGEEWVCVTFAEKPDRSILDALKAAGFRWGSGSWHGRRDALPASITEAKP
jgi:hypothetical protein